jgi:hypothetical protein
MSAIGDICWVSRVEDAVTEGLSESIIAPLTQRLIGHVRERRDTLHGRRRW